VAPGKGIEGQQDVEPFLVESGEDGIDRDTVPFWDCAGGQAEDGGQGPSLIAIAGVLVEELYGGRTTGRSRGRDW